MTSEHMHPDMAKAMVRESKEVVAAAGQLVELVETLAGRIEQVRQVHPKQESLVNQNKDYCGGCDEYWPCPTIQAIGEKP